MQLNMKERALLLAALRLLQESIVDERMPPADIYDILVDADAENVTPQQIDNLCERLNAAAPKRVRRAKPLPGMQRDNEVSQRATLTGEMA